MVRVTEAKAHLSPLMAWAGFGGERFLIERRESPLAALFAARGGLVEDAGIGTMLGEIYAARERDTGRTVDLEA